MRKIAIINIISAKNDRIDVVFTIQWNRFHLKC